MTIWPRVLASLAQAWPEAAERHSRRYLNPASTAGEVPSVKVAGRDWETVQRPAEVPMTFSLAHPVSACFCSQPWSPGGLERPPSCGTRDWV